MSEVPPVGLCYQLVGENISVLSSFISLPADDNTDNSGPKDVPLWGARNARPTSGLGARTPTSPHSTATGVPR